MPHFPPTTTAHGTSRAVASIRAAAMAAAGLTLWATLPSGLAGQARSVVNGGFETPVITSNWAPVDDALVPGWTSPDGVIEIWQDGFNGVNAISGGQFAEANANSPSGFTQAVCLLAGEQVPWSFWHRGRQGVDSMIVKMGGTEIMRVGTGTAAWVQYTDTFTVPTSGPYDVTFEPINQGSYGNFVDDLHFELIPHVEFAPDNAGIETGAGDPGPRLMVSGTLTSTESVDVIVTGGTATPGTDFLADTVTVLLPPGTYDGTVATAVPVDIAVQDDGNAEGDETVTFGLANPSAGIRLANADAAACGSPVRLQGTFTIADDEATDLAVSKAGPTTGQSGTPYTYTITTSNLGPTPAAGVVVADTLPTGAALVSATRGATAAGGVVTWPAIASLAVGASIVDTVVITYPSAGAYQQKATLLFSGNDTNTGNNADALSVNVCGSTTTTVSTVAELRAATSDDCVAVVYLTPGLYDLTSSGSGHLNPSADKQYLNAGGGEVVIDAEGASRVFQVRSGVSVVIDGLTIQGGSVSGDGGGIRVRGALTLRNSTLTNNTAGDDGGGLFQQNGGTVTLENVTVSQNGAPSGGGRGGGLDVRNGAVLTHVTVAQNVAGTRGGGINIRGGGAVLTNILVADNTQSAGEQINGAATFAGTNLVEGCTSCGAGVLTQDPALLPLALSGTARVHEPSPGSPAIDAAATGLSTDQRGVSRPRGSGYDLGAVEVIPPLTVSVTPDGLVSPVQRTVGTGYAQAYQLTNGGTQAQDLDLIASVVPGGTSPFLTVDSITGAGVSGVADSARIVGVGGGATASVTVWYSAAFTSLGTVDSLRLLARVTAQPLVTDLGWAEVEFAGCGVTSVVVSTMADLRSAWANPCISTIGLTPGTYVLASSGSGELVTDRDLTVYNTGGGEVILDGGLSSRIFRNPAPNTLTLTGLTLTRGYAPIDGGAIDNAGTVVVENSLLVGNRAGDDGAGIENTGTMTIRNSTFSGNQADDDGGAFQSDGGTVTLTHVTIVGNQAGSAGAETGGAFKLTAGATVFLNNSLIGDNIQGGATPIDAAGGTVISNGANAVEGGCAGCLPGSDITVDVGILPLAYNGGNTRTHATVPTSPSVDAADPADGLPTDQRGFPRPEGAGYDIGAFERSASYEVAVTPDGLGTPLQRTDGTGYSHDFWVANLSTGAQDIDLLGSVAGPLTGSPFLSVDSIVGPGVMGVPDSVRVPAVPSGDSVQVQVFFTVAGGAPAQVDTLRLQARLAAQIGVTDFGQIEVERICGSGAATVGSTAELRAAVADGCISTITVAPGTYDLTTAGSGPLVVDRPLTIQNAGGGEARFDGGGVSRVLEIATGGNATLTGITVTGGSATGSGGGVLVSGTLTFRQGTITGNSSGNDGGGLAMAAGAVLIMENATVSGNTSADRGGGLDLQGTATLTHVTVASNSAGGLAGGINVRGGATALRNAIVADNTQAGSQQVVVGGTLNSNGANVVEGGCGGPCSSDLTGDPGLQPLALNGGDSQTHALNASSIALDQASTADALPTDQRGVARPQDAGPDMGAYEAIVGVVSLSVTADSAASVRLPSNGIGYTETYTVTNLSATARSYVLRALSGGAAVTVDSIRGGGVTYGTPPDSALTPGIASGDSIKVDVHYRVDDVAAGTIDPTVLQATDAGVPLVQGADTVNVTVAKPLLSISKVASVSGSAVPGARVTYQLQVTNVGSYPAEAVAVLDSIPVEMDFEIGSTTQTLPAGIGFLLEYADAPAAWGYTPADGACGAPAGFDRCVRYVRWTLQVPLPSLAPNNQGNFSFTARIR